MGTPGVRCNNTAYRAVVTTSPKCVVVPAGVASYTMAVTQPHLPVATSTPPVSASSQPNVFCRTRSFCASHEIRATGSIGRSVIRNYLEKVKASFYIAQYPLFRTVQSALLP